MPLHFPLDQPIGPPPPYTTVDPHDPQRQDDVDLAKMPNYINVRAPPPYNIAVPDPTLKEKSVHNHNHIEVCNTITKHQNPIRSLRPKDHTSRHMTLQQSDNKLLQTKTKIEIEIEYQISLKATYNYK